MLLSGKSTYFHLANIMFNLKYIKIIITIWIHISVSKNKFYVKYFILKKEKFYIRKKNRKKRKSKLIKTTILNFHSLKRLQVLQLKNDVSNIILNIRM